MEGITIHRFFLLLALIFASMTAQAATPPAAAYFSDDPACKVKAIRKITTTFENAALSPAGDMLAVTKLDQNGVYQVYVGKANGADVHCISCAKLPGGPRLDRNKPMISWHPSGRWLVVGIEEDKHDNMWMPKSWQRGFLQSGIWLNMWLTTPAGDRWYRVTDFKKPAHGPSDGFVGTPFTPDGRHAVWAEIIDGNIFANHFGIWRLFMADFAVGREGAPSLTNKRDITPAGARWVEPGNFAPDGRRLLLSSDVGMKDAQGQDQFILDTASGALKNLTNSPDVWDEHGIFSPDGRKVSFMSSYPYRDRKGSNQTAALRTEFMLIDADGSHLQQVTHFNAPGYPESQGAQTIAAVAGFMPDGAQMFAMVMAPGFTKSNWTIDFAGKCGKR